MALALLLSACGTGPGMAPETRASTAGVSASSNTVPMVVYTPRGTVDQSTLTPLPSPEELGAIVIEGNPKLFGRVDYQSGGITAGLFMSTTGVVSVPFPYTEHSTILEGEVTLTDETGQKRSFKPGDSFLVRQGQVIIWDVKGKYVIKTFMNIVEQ